MTRNCFWWYLSHSKLLIINYKKTTTTPKQKQQQKTKQNKKHTPMFCWHRRKTAKSKIVKTKKENDHIITLATLCTNILKQVHQQSLLLESEHPSNHVGYIRVNSVWNIKQNFKKQVKQAKIEQLHNLPLLQALEKKEKKIMLRTAI